MTENPRIKFDGGVSSSHYLTPTYQSLLILGMDTAARRLAEGDLIAGWEALRALFAMLPPDCQKECCDDFDAIKERLAEIGNIQGYTMLHTISLKTTATRECLDWANFQLFNKFKNSLFAKGYLENAPTRPRNLQPTTLGE